tara:strand:+ start:1160 stop:1612 length:453 start_codon:yes stop_codon:yes gene_type:complete
MNVILTEENFDISNIYYNEPIQNTVMNNSKFIKIIYSNEYIILNGLYLLLTFKNISKETYFKKIKVKFDINNNKELLKFIYKAEEKILNKYSTTKRQKKIIFDTMNVGSIKLFPDGNDDLNNNKNTFILKISGIWEDQYEYGLTYKIIAL